MSTKFRVAAISVAVAIGCAGAAGAAGGSSTTSTSSPRSAKSTSAKSTVKPSAKAVPRSGSKSESIRPLPKSPRGPFDRKKATSILKSVVTKRTDTLREPKDVQVVFGPLTAGRFLADLKAEQGELDEYGWTKAGTASVVSLKVTKTKGKTATVSACLDQSKVSVRDAKGKSIGSSDVPRAMHLYDYSQQADGSWRITAHRFPTDPTC